MIGVVGLAAYNWWVLVPFQAGLLRSPNGFFSDLEVPGQPDAAIMQHLDLLAGVLLLIALLLRGSSGRKVARRAEWSWMLVFAVAGIIGERFPYTCSEGTSPTCRALEWHFQLPVHHYVHIVSGIAEFVALTVAAVLAHRRTKGDSTIEASVHRFVVVALKVGYPLLGVAYLTDRLGVFVEPIFFLAFTAMAAAVLFEPRFTRSVVEERTHGRTVRSPARHVRLWP